MKKLSAFTLGKLAQFVATLVLVAAVLVILHKLDLVPSLQPLPVHAALSR
jgi:hypothetical protein